MQTFKTLVATELKLSIRDMNMPIFALGFPVAISIILGMIYGSQPAFAGASYSFLEQSFGAVAAIGISAAGLMGLPIVISDYRHKKILKRFKVTPISPVLLLAAQVFVNLLMTVCSIVLIYAIFSLGFEYKMHGSWLIFASVFLLVAFAIFSIGLLIAAVSPNIQTSNILCTIAYFPMLIFSGATLPYEIMPSSIQWIADFMPLTQGIKLLKQASLGLSFDNSLIPILGLIGISVVCSILSVKCFKWE